MNKNIIMLAGLVALMTSPLLADDMKMDKTGMGHGSMCEKHCNIMDLQKQIDALKSQVNSADKTATKEHLRKDIEKYEKKLQNMEKELEQIK